MTRLTCYYQLKMRPNCLHVNYLKIEQTKKQQKTELVLIQFDKCIFIDSKSTPVASDNKKRSRAFL